MHPLRQTYFFCLLMIIGSGALYAQCPTSNQTFITQNNLDKFLQDYPNCTEFDGDITIDISANGPVGPSTLYPITSLYPLQNLTSIHGTLKIKGPTGIWDGNPSFLNNFLGLLNLNYVHELWIEDLPQIYSYSGTGNIKEVDILRLIEMPNVGDVPGAPDGIMVNDTLIIEENNLIQSLDKIIFPESMKMIQLEYNSNLQQDMVSKLDEVTEVDHLSIQGSAFQSFGSDVDLTVNETLILQRNASLEDISGLTFPKEMEIIELRDNPLLTNGVENFENIESINTRLFIGETLDFSFFSPLKHIGDLTIFGEDDATDFNVFQNLESIGSIWGSNMPNLLDLSVFEGVDFLGYEVTLSNMGISHLNEIVLNPDSLYTSINLRALENLTDISFLSPVHTLKDLRITENHSLDNLVGLENLQRVKNQFSLIDLPEIKDLSSIANLQYANVLDLVALEVTDLSGLENFKEIGSNLRVRLNPELDNLDALANTEYIGEGNLNFNEIEISGNPKLNSIEGLNDLKGVVQRRITIQDNPELSHCSLDFICSQMSYGEAIFLISGNKEDCNSPQEVEDRCGFNYMEVFLDDNGNGIQEASEPNINIGEIKVGDQFLLYPNNQGRVGFFLLENPGFIEYVPEPFWEVTTANAYTNTPDLLQVPDLIKIGIRGTSNFVDVDTHLAFETVVCDRAYDIYVTVKNEGTRRIQAEVTFTAPGDYIPIWPFPNDTSNNVIVFNFENLLPGEAETGKVVFQAPSIQEVDLDSVLEFNYETKLTDDDGEWTLDNGVYQTTFLCAYDPNDKQVWPMGEQEENYTLFEEDEFEYLIRFQNTGNYPAQDVSITDTLDFNLDPSTFEYINASHEVSRIKLEGYNLSFDFKNIFLPDSISNEPESHGFVQFKIKRKEGLAENTRIENTAHIYFDFNPAIVTNTVFNTMVTMIPSSVDNETLRKSFSLLPNPSTGEFTLRQERDTHLRKWKIMDLHGSMIAEGLTEGYTTRININHLTPGLYFVELEGEVQKLIVQ